MQLGSVLTLVALSVGVSSVAPHVVAAAPRVLDRSVLVDSDHAYTWSGGSTDWSAARGASYGYDVTHYDLDLAVDFGVPEIIATGTMTVTITEADLTSLTVDLNDMMTVTGVTVDGLSRFYTTAEETISITLPSAPAIGAELVVAVSYRGRPSEVGTKSMRFRTHGGIPVVYTLSTPFSNASVTVIPISHYWRPCKDDPTDKSTYSASLTVPDTMTGVTNGVMISETDNLDGTKTFVWEHGYPIAPYLITIGITNYVEITDTYVGDTHTLPISHYAYPELVTQATSDWAPVTSHLAAFEDRFGTFPFTGERYGMYMIEPGPAVEHQTMVSYPRNIVDGSGDFEYIVAHELVHMWFGDEITVADWKDVWLSEGFASYGEAIYEESVGGATALRDYMMAMDAGPYAGTMYDPPYVWHAIVYDKGAWVLHMLRHVLGDAGFDQLIADYRAAHAGGNVVTTDFIAVAEGVHGSSLSWFFDPWVYEEGRPSYAYSWIPETTAGLAVSLTLDQVQSLDQPTYTMPIDVEIQTASGTEQHVIMNDMRSQSFSIPVGDTPIAVTLDPGRWILGSFVEEPVGVATGPAAPWGVDAPVPNPAFGATTISFLTATPGRVAVRVFDVAGRHVRTLTSEVLSAGPHTVTWDGRDRHGEPVAAGSYRVRLVGPDGVDHASVLVVR